MSYNSIWIFLVILQAYVTSLPIQDRFDLDMIGIDQKPKSTSPEAGKYDDTADSEKEQVISVRITSSVAVGRGKEKLPYTPMHKYGAEVTHSYSEIPSTATQSTPPHTEIEEQTMKLGSDLPQKLIGANIEYIKQLNAKKESKDHNVESPHPIQSTVHNQQPSENYSFVNETPAKIYEYDDDIKDFLTARKVPSASDANRFHEYKENRGNQYSNIKDSVEFGFKINTDTNKSVANGTKSQIINQQINEKENGAINTYIPSNDNYHMDDSIAESSIKSVEFAKTTATVSPSSNYFHSLPNRHLKSEPSNPRLTTVSFNVIHDETKPSDNDHSESYITSSQIVPNQQQFYSPPKIYSQPSKIYSEPSKFYSEPAKVYSEPAKIYSEPSKVYSVPSKVYSEPAKFYSEPASLHLNDNVPQVPLSVPPSYSSWHGQAHHSVESSTINTTPVSAMTNSYQLSSRQMEHQPERNYEVEENISVLTDGRSHGIQESSTEKCKQDNCKVGYVVEGRQYKKYRVEERTSDGFIVGEYGVVRNEDGALRGVRYTADSDASPRLIHDALMKFLQLK